MENPIKMDDLGVPLFLETSMWQKDRADGDENVFEILWFTTIAVPAQQSHQYCFLATKVVLLMEEIPNNHLGWC